MKCGRAGLLVCGGGVWEIKFKTLNNLTTVFDNNKHIW